MKTKDCEFKEICPVEICDEIENCHKLDAKILEDKILFSEHDMGCFDILTNPVYNKPLQDIKDLGEFQEIYVPQFHLNYDLDPQ